MSDEQQVWGRLPGEDLTWFRRFERFRLMEPERSIPAVYREITQNDEVNAPGDWYKKAKQWRWEERAEAWDTYQTEKEEKLIAKERAKVLRSQFALMHKRVEVLNAIATDLIAMISDEDRVWLPDVKSIGAGPTAQRVDLVQFNADLFREIREYLTDIAEETGGRVKKTESTIKSLPKVYIDMRDDEDGSEE